MGHFADGQYHPGGRWESRALTIMQHLADERIIEARDEGYTDALLAAGIALDLGELSGDASKMEYARRGWSAALRMLTPPPSERPRPHPAEPVVAGGVMSTNERTEFERLAEQFTGGGADLRNGEDAG
jgi:hypothetical protein